MTSTSWRGGSGGWGTTTSWTNGVPNSSTAEATIAVAGEYTVTLGATKSFIADSVTLDNTGATLDIAGTLSLSGMTAALILEAGTLDLGGKIAGGHVTVETGGVLLDQGGTLGTATSFDLASGGTLDLGGHTLTVAGSAQILGAIDGPGALFLSKAELNGITLSGGALLKDTGSVRQDGNVTLGLSGTDSAMISISGNDVYNVLTDSTISAAGSATIINGGLFEKTGGTGTTTVEAVFSNTGEIEISSGVLQLDGGGYLAGNIKEGVLALDGGTFSLATSAKLNVATLNLGAGEVILAQQAFGGALNVSNNAVLDLGGFTDGFSGAIALESATIEGPGTLEFTGTGSFGNLLLASTSDEYGVVIDDFGSMVQVGNVQIGNNASAVADIDVGGFNGKSVVSGVYDIIGNSSISVEGNAEISDEGVFEKTGGTGLATVAANFNNDGAVIVNAGTLLLEKDSFNYSGGELVAANWVAADGATLGLGTTVAISNDQAQITLSGAGAEFESGVSANTKIETSLATISGELVLAGGKNYVTSNHVTVVGNLIVSGGTFEAASLLVTSALVEGSVTVSNGGLVVSAQLVNETTETVETGGVASATVVDYGSVQTISAGGIARGTILHTGGQYILSGGTASSTVINGGNFVSGGQVISAGGTAYATSITVSGIEDVSGVASGVMVSSGGVQQVFSGGIASSAVVYAHGTANIYASARAIGATISGGFQNVGSGGFSSATVIDSGGTLQISGGIDYGALVNAGGIEQIVANGTVAAAKIGGGLLNLGTAATATSGVTFTTNSGTFEIQSDVMPMVTISGFVAGDVIDLPALSYASSDTVSVKQAGVVTILANNGYAYNLNIAGATVGETDFAFNSNSQLIRTGGAAKMAFIGAVQAHAPVPKGAGFPALADVVAGGAGVGNVSAATRLRDAPNVSAHDLEGGYNLLAVVHGGGVQTLPPWHALAPLA